MISNQGWLAFWLVAHFRGTTFLIQLHRMKTNQTTESSHFELLEALCVKRSGHTLSILIYFNLTWSKERHYNIILLIRSDHSLCRHREDVVTVSFPFNIQALLIFQLSAILLAQFGSSQYFCESICAKDKFYQVRLCDNIILS